MGLSRMRGIEGISNPQLSILMFLTSKSLRKSVSLSFDELWGVIEDIPEDKIQIALNNSEKFVRSVVSSAHSKYYRVKGFGSYYRIPLDLKIKANRKFYAGERLLPIPLLIIILQKYRKTIRKDLLKEIKKQFNVDLPKEDIPENISNTCSVDDFNRLIKKYPQIDVFLTLAICGVMVTDEELDIKKSDKPLVDIKNFIESNKKYLNYHKTAIKKYRKVNSMIRNLVKYLPINNNWKKSADLKKMDRIK